MSASPIKLVPLESVAMRSIEWHEKPLWQASAFQLLAGPKGAGKGTYLAGLAARLSHRGLACVFIVSEDSWSIDLVPRLHAADADMSKCYGIERRVRLPDDVEQLRQLLAGRDVGLLVIDPVANHIGNRQTNDEGEVRDAIAPLNALADELACLLIGVRHVGKDRSRGALASILGSTAWIDTPRAVVMIAHDDEDEQLRHIQVVAGNRAGGSAAQVFRIDAVPVEGLSEPITLAVELGELEKSVDDLISAERREGGSKTDKARELILDILVDEGQQESDALDARVAQEAGLASATVRNVRKGLSSEGLIRSVPQTNPDGTVATWHVRRTNAPRA